MLSLRSRLGRVERDWRKVVEELRVLDTRPVEPARLRPADPRRSADNQSPDDEDQMSHHLHVARAKVAEAQSLGSHPERSDLQHAADRAHWASVPR